MVSLRSSGRTPTPVKGLISFHILAALSFLILAAGADARTWYVKPDGTGDAPTIQAAIDSATAGDEVLLALGAYTWTSQGASGPSMLRMKRNVNLRGEDGAATTILDAELSGRVIEAVDVDQARIEGVTVTRGRIFFQNGAGIISSGDSRQTIVNCVARANEVINGGGGGIACGGGNILNCEILDNEGETGGGIVIGNGVVSGCTVRGNGVTGDPGGQGGGIAAFGSAEIGDCLIESNSAFGPFGSDGGGIYAVGQTSTTRITRCIFVNNFAGSGSGSGGAIRCFEGVSISDCVFIGNTAAGSRFPGVGGAISCGTPSQVSVTRCTLIGNRGVNLGPPHVVPPVGGINVDGNGATTVGSVIIAWSEGAACLGTSATWSCNDLYGNSLGDGLCGTDAGGNFSADPQFCASDPAASLNFTLQGDSPCAPGNHPDGVACGLIGAAPVGCGTVSIQNTSWTRLKALYR